MRCASNRDTPATRPSAAARRAPKLRYPRGVDGLVRQCAWCCRVKDGAGLYSLEAPAKIRGATHGCCQPCSDRVLADVLVEVDARRSS